MTADREPHPAVAAAMELLPNGPDPDGIVAWTTIDGRSVSISREELAADIAVRVLRWAADQLASENGVCEAHGNSAPYPLGDWRVRGMAREIEDQYRTEGEPNAD